MVSADGARLFSADWGGTIREWNTVTNRQIGVFGNRGCKVEIHCLALTTNGRLLFSGDSEGNITQWLVAEAQSTRVRTFSPREQLQSVRTLCLSVDEQSLFSSSNDNTICQWSVTTGVLMHKIVIGVRVYVLRAAMNAHSLFAASDTGISQWSTLTWHRLHTSPQERRVRSMIVSEDGRFLLAGLFDDAHFTIHQWSLETLQEVRVFEGHTSGVVCLAVSTTRPWLFSGSDDNTIRLWSLLTGRCLHIFNGHTAGVKSIAVSRNGRWLYSGSENGVVRKWPLGVDA